MILYLMQHGESLSQEVDPARPLSEEGRLRVEKVARSAAAAGVYLPRIYHSGKLRARQTADILGAALGSAVEERSGLAPNDPVEPVAEWLESLKAQGPGAVGLVGHLPFLDRLASLLVTGNQESGVIAFRYGALVRLGLRPGSQGHRVECILWPEFGE